MKLSIIIVNYRSRAYLEKCLSSIFTKIKPDFSFEVLVVNNGVAEELVGLAELFSKIKIIQNTSNDGFGGANNFGAKEAQGEFLFFLNPDAEIFSANFSEVLAEFETDPALGVLGIKLIDIKGEVQDWIAGGEISLGNILKNNFGRIADKKYWQSDEKIAVSWVAGTAFFMRKSLFLQLGGFDDKFFLYFEDADLCQRARDLGKGVVYFPAFSVLHHGGKSFSDKGKQKKAYYLSQDYYFKKHRGFFESLFLRILRFFSF